MYFEYFGFHTPPFSIAPDPQYLYMSQRHREALAHLLYGVRESCGFVVLTGEVGTGKTTLCRCLLEQLPATTDIAFIFSPRLSPLELLSAVCDEFHIPYPQETSSLKERVDRIYRFLLRNHAAGRKAVLIIDEAQNLSVKVLEQLRLLTNLETTEHKLLQIILLGQPQLRQLLDRPDLQQLAQRITARYHLQPLLQADVAAYVAHRLGVAGCHRKLFPPATLRRLYRLSGGVPRIINLLCDRALMGAYARDVERVSPALLSQAAREVFGPPPPSRWARRLGVGLLVLVTIVAGMGLAQLLRSRGGISLRTVTTAPATVDPPPSPWWPASPDGEDSERAAYGELLRRWGLELPATASSACDEARRQGGLDCLFQRGSLGFLRQYNRPAVLSLVTPRGQEFHGLLTAIREGKAELWINGESHRLPLAALDAAWLGRFVLLWRPPAAAQGDGTPLSREQLQQWVREQLPRVPGMADIPLADLPEALRIFQAREGLPADGLIGPMTLMRLEDCLGEGSPQLTE